MSLTVTDGVCISSLAPATVADGPAVRSAAEKVSSLPSRVATATWAVAGPVPPGASRKASVGLASGLALRSVVLVAVPTSAPVVAGLVIGTRNSAWSPLAASATKNSARVPAPSGAPIKAELFTSKPAVTATGTSCTSAPVASSTWAMLTPAASLCGANT